MIQREILKELLLLLKEYPVVTVLGPRQAGKTTLVRDILKGYAYANLEQPEIRELAKTDPKAFLAQFPGKVILDEIQRSPELLSYIQILVDSRPGNGQVILTGSHQLQLHEAVSQSLAGRTALLSLLPLSIRELEHAAIKFESWQEYAFHGFLPRIYDQAQRPTRAYSNYFQTYVERDLRQLIHIKNISLFEKFMKLLAGRVGQLMNYSAMANDVGVDVKTIQNWFSILEASFILFKLPPYFENFGKRIVKAPKYYFVDTGLLCFLLDIEKPEQLARDPLVGHIFENMMVMECVKSLSNQGRKASLYFYRDNNGNEIDLLHKSGNRLQAIEIKSASTFSDSQLKGLKRFQNISQNEADMYLIYNGDSYTLSNRISVLNFRQVNSLFD